MEANLLLGMSSLVIGIGAGMTLLVLHRKNGNGHKPETQPARPDVPDWQLERDTAMKELVDRLDYLPVRMEQAFRHSLEAQPKEPEIPPDWAAHMLGELEHIHVESEQLVKVATNLERLTDRIDAFMQMPPPPAPEIPRVNDLIAGIQALVNAGRKRAAKSPFQPVIPETDDPVEIPPPPQALVPTPPSQPPERVQRQPGPPSRAANPVYLEEFNTVLIPQDTVVEMIPPEEHVFSINVMNLGPGTIFLRENAEPVLDDPHATKLPPGTGDNGMRAPLRLYALADVGGADISVRLTFGG